MVELAHTRTNLMRTPYGNVTWRTSDLESAHRSEFATRKALCDMVTLGNIATAGSRFVGTIQNVMSGALAWCHLSHGEKVGLLTKIAVITGRPESDVTVTFVQKLARYEDQWNHDRRSYTTVVA